MGPDSAWFLPVWPGGPAVTRPVPPARPSRAGLRLDLAPALSSLEPCRLAMDELLAAHQVDRTAVYRCELVLEEVFVNIVLHATSLPAGACIGFEAEVRETEVRLVFTDPGAAFDPTTLPEPDLPAHLTQGRPGGLGVMLVRRLALDMSYRRDQGLNRLQVRVARQPLPGPAAGS